MILSVSRRTDIPSYYFEWFSRRLKEGFVLVRNPGNRDMVSRVELSPSTVECMVFWTKNPAPMLDQLEVLAPYPFYVQFTLNPYGKELEANLPEKATLADTFKRLASRIGRERVVWRYSPIIINSVYTGAFHLESFAAYCRQLRNATAHCRISFLEMYPKIGPRMAALGIEEAPRQECVELAMKFAAIASGYGITVGACGDLDNESAGLDFSPCIDRRLIERVAGGVFPVKKDRNQKKAGCRCVESVDIGAYQTCLNGCAYCYANHSAETALRRYARYDPRSPMLCDALRPTDIIVERKIRLHREAQLSLFT